ncbi:hypothetical protein PIB30_026778 [Stylosanthes scabra]|uniref:Uncharacterized protein n=1 Tax=Stylosanthes scabra TaxID=79078 RepID=A0ABU6Y8T8_9FABA|nr:hypothetical protein [Stylosanthes scabra]
MRPEIESCGKNTSDQYPTKPGLSVSASDQDDNRKLHETAVVPTGRGRTATAHSAEGGSFVVVAFAKASATVSSFRFCIPRRFLRPMLGESYTSWWNSGCDQLVRL